MNTEDTPDDPGDNDIIKNAETRKRRAWVNRAVEGVRRRLERGEPPGEARSPPRPRLTVVPTPRKR